MSGFSTRKAPAVYTHHDNGCHTDGVLLSPGGKSCLAWRACAHARPTRCPSQSLRGASSDKSHKSQIRLPACRGVIDSHLPAFQAVGRPQTRVLVSRARRIPRKSSLSNPFSPRRRLKRMILGIRCRRQPRTSFKTLRLFS